MATPESIARDLLASMNTDAGFLNAITWINGRYREICERVPMPHLRELGELYVPKYVSTGTIEITDTLGTACTGSSTSWGTAPLSTGAANGYWYFKCRSNWYKVESFDSSTTLTLSTYFVEATGSSLSYHIVKRFHLINSSASHLGKFMNTRRRMEFDPVPNEALNEDAPGRTLTGSYPTYVCDAGLNSSGEPWIELYPYASTHLLLHYVFWRRAASLGATESFPACINPRHLREGALIDLYRYMKAEAIAKGQLEAAAIYRNDEMTQNTKWEKIIMEAHRAARLVDNTSAVLYLGKGKISRGDIRTARDIVVDRWSYP